MIHRATSWNWTLTFSFSFKCGENFEKTCNKNQKENKNKSKEVPLEWWYCLAVSHEEEITRMFIWVRKSALDRVDTVWMSQCLHVHWGSTNLSAFHLQPL